MRALLNNNNKQEAYNEIYRHNYGKNYESRYEKFDMVISQSKSVVFIPSIIADITNI